MPEIDLEIESHAPDFVGGDVRIGPITDEVYVGAENGKVVIKVRTLGPEGRQRAFDVLADLSRRAQGLMSKLHKVATCSSCGGPFVPTRVDANYCSNSCRQKAYRDRIESNAHILYETGDADAPDAIKDNNGEVCLSLCKRCGMAECQLDANPVCKPQEKKEDERSS